MAAWAAPHRSLLHRSSRHFDVRIGELQCLEPRSLEYTQTHLLTLPRAVCARGRTVLATAFKPAHEEGRSRGLRFELYAMVCGMWVCAVAVRSAIVAIAQSARRAVCDISVCVYVPVLGSTVELAHDLRFSGKPKIVYHNMV